MLGNTRLAARPLPSAASLVQRPPAYRPRRQRAAFPCASAAPRIEPASNTQTDTSSSPATEASAEAASVDADAAAASSPSPFLAAVASRTGTGTTNINNSPSAPTTAASPAAPATPPAAAPAVAPSADRAAPSGRPQKMRLRAILDIEAGPPRITPLLLDAETPIDHTTVGTVLPEGTGDRSHLPLMLYLPGIDGSGLAASRQFPSLLQKFDMRTLVTPIQDRTAFPELVKIVADYLRQHVPAYSPTRPVYVLGESFGGLLALAVAAEVPALVDRLVLVNPATSFSSSLWPLIGPLLPQVPRELYRALPLALAPVLGNPINLLLAGIDSTPGASVRQQAASLVDTAVNLLQQLPALAEILPAETLAWKLELLREGGLAVEGLLPRIQQRCFLLVGDQDRLIPSGEEGPRLQRALPRAQLRVEKGRSHALLQEGGVDLSAILEAEGFYTPVRRMSAPISKRSAAGFGVAAPIELPTPGEIDRYAERTTAIGRRLSSPVFMSTGADGRRCLGLGQVPSGRPLLLVGNHQTLALDLGVITEQFLREQGVLPRGLAHPVIFAQAMEGTEGSGEAGSAAASSSSSSGSSSSSNGLPSWDPIATFGAALQGMQGSSSSSRRSDTGGGSNTFRDFMTTFGAVPVSGFNMHRLLAAGETVLLFPGGVREAYKGRGEDYQLFWPERSEFIRMAARFGATIVPFAAVGVDDSLEILADSRQLEAMPIVGDMLRRRGGGLPQARQGVSAAAAEAESFVAPLAVPKLPPNRLYFLFQQPIQTSPEDVKDRERCDELYRQTKQSVQEGLSWLQQQRQRDPYKDFLPRQLYEAAYRGRQAPTFPLH
ncbi:hypothetical protein D9Q98_006664 [Chlorella vulgaris]|uniref:Serine aminopeptidase S33 domain-containing protein n=1 Tax=Chlorella vulgaris TaxID=3077 RepID=A0A9D4TLH1_CHLVU|nr:hypothetical protein D9Q98_006664 [Chlorella vulgaris]